MRLNQRLISTTSNDTATAWTRGARRVPTPDSQQR
jgi:hypothetical protein